MNQMNKRGIMILCPMGSGKSFFLVNHPEITNILDGDVILNRAGIKNRNYYWYEQKYRNERDAIIVEFEKHLQNGESILYSANPRYIKFDLIIYVSEKTRRENLKNAPDRFLPDDSQIIREKQAYLAFKAYKNFKFFDNFPEKIELLTMMEWLQL